MVTPPTLLLTILPMHFAPTRQYDLLTVDVSLGAGRAINQPTDFMLQAELEPATRARVRAEYQNITKIL